ncbi:MAG: LIC_13355 family lipoprotein [Sandaracinaceae bacterium]
MALAVVGCDVGPREALDASASTGDGAVLVGPSTPVIADEIVDAPGATGEGFGDATRTVNGVRGGGASQGSLDVYSLDYAERTYLVLGFHGGVITDGPGADLVVFENPFRYAAGTGNFMDPVIVSVSRDSETWVDLPHDYVAADPTRYSIDPDDWVGFAGVTPVLLHAEDHAVDPFDRVAAGGDHFDLGDLDDSGEAGAIRREGARYVRLESAATRVDPDTGERYPRDPTSNGADIDGVYARYVVRR